MTTINTFIIGLGFSLTVGLGCGTIGLDPQEFVIEVEASNPNITRFQANNLTLDGSLLIAGGADRFTGAVHATAWMHTGEDVEPTDWLFFEFAPVQTVMATNAVPLQDKVERLTINDIEFGIPSGVGVDVRDIDSKARITDIDGTVNATLTDDIAIASVVGTVTAHASRGEVSASSIDGSLDVSAGQAISVTGVTGNVLARTQTAVSISDVQGDVTATGESILIERSGVMDIEVSGLGSVQTGRDNAIEGRWVDIEVTNSDFDSLSVDATGGSATVTLPLGGFVLDLVGGNPNASGDSNTSPVNIDVDGLQISDLEIDGTFVIGGGGPTITIRGRSLRVFQ